MHIYRKGTIIVDGKHKIEDVIFVKGLRHNLLNVSQMCRKRYHTFQEKGCEIKKGILGRLIAKGTRTNGNIYHPKEAKGSNYLVVESNQIWLWCKRIGHVNFDNMVKINSTHAIRDMPKIIKHTNTICKECQLGK